MVNPSSPFLSCPTPSSQGEIMTAESPCQVPWELQGLAFTAELVKLQSPV